MISAKMILDSISPGGVRLATLELVYPKFIHGEFMTHRVFSRNASSSRAIPVETMLKRIRSEPAGPEEWGSAKKGMQAGEEIADTETAKALWLKAAQQACDMAEEMLKLNLHKQIVNRILEPFMHIHVLVTATEWSNFFELRDHPDAQPEIRILAQKMKEEFSKSSPKILSPGEWHLPFVSEEERGICIQDLLKISTARCARVSYLNHDGSKPDVVKDIELYNRLVGAKPIHASPTEHQATPVLLGGLYWNGNFRAWRQYRKIIEKNFEGASV